MDYPPLIPNITDSHDVSHILSEAFQDTLSELNFPPSNIAENIIKYKVDNDMKLLKEYGRNVKKHDEKYNIAKENIKKIEDKVLKKKAAYKKKQSEIEQDAQIKEQYLLKRDDLFDNLSEHSNSYGLIEKRHILPSLIDRCTDFVYSPNVVECASSESLSSHEATIKSSTRRRVSPSRKQLQTLHLLKFPHQKQDTSPQLKVTPDAIYFDNYELSVTYTRKIRLQNISKKYITFIYKPLTKYSPFSIKILTKNDRLAAGMSAEFRIVFNSNIYLNHNAKILFRTTDGSSTVLKLTAHRKPPLFTVYMFRSQFRGGRVCHCCPGDINFWNTRCKALNNFVDFGSCMVGISTFCSLILDNIGTDGIFFIVSEDEWLSGKILEEEKYNEFKKGFFTIFPRYFRVMAHETSEICLLFTPDTFGLHSEKIYLLCDNNVCQELEITADAVHFNKHLIQMEYYGSKSLAPFHLIKEENKHIREILVPDHCIFLESLESNKMYNFIFRFTNNCGLYFEYYWNFENIKRFKTVKYLDPSLIKLKDSCGYFSPYSVTELEIELSTSVIIEGYYNIFLSMFVTDIPLLSLEENIEFFIQNEREIFGEQIVDVRLCEFEIGCYITVKTGGVQKQQEIKAACPCSMEPSLRPPSLVKVELPKLEFVKKMLDLGVLPEKMHIKRLVEIYKFPHEEVKWKIIEMVYQIDSKPSMMIFKNSSISKSEGILKATEDLEALDYVIETSEPRRWVSFLLLFRIENDQYIFESLSLVTYEVVKWDIKISTSVSNLPILCPMELHYVNRPKKYTLYIQNRTFITGCFWLFPPIGEDSKKVKVTYTPKHSILTPGKKVSVEVEVNPTESGILEKIYIPCFFAKHVSPIFIRLMCAVDDINLFFFLPNDNGFDKILWPPKIVNDYDYQSMNSLPAYTVDEETENEYDNQKLDQNRPVITSSSSSSTSYESSEFTFNKSSMDSHASSCEHVTVLTGVLKEAFGYDCMLQDNVIELHNVPRRTLQKVTFYIENITPVVARYSIEATNFHANNENRENLLKVIGLKYMHYNLDHWEQACKINRGIVIVPDTSEGTIVGGETLEVNVWVYASTWGIYMEEIAVDINDIATFIFTIIVDVDGPQIEFPIALNTARTYPTLRFGHIAYHSNQITQRLKISNTNAIPVHIVWHLFDPKKDQKRKLPFNAVINIFDENFSPSEDHVKFFISNRYYGAEEEKFIKISPHNVHLPPNSTETVEITIIPKFFSINFDETDFEATLIGYVFISKEDESRTNYFYRRSAEFLRPLHVDILGTLAMPLLKLELLSEKSKMNAYAIDVTAELKCEQSLRLIFKNKNLTPVTCSFHIDPPFYIVSVDMLNYTTAEEIKHAIIKPDEITELKIKCVMTYKIVQNMADWVYEKNKKKNPPHGDQVDVVNKAVVICKHLNIHQRGVLEQTVPISFTMYYPKITASPKFVKFDYVLFGCSKAAVVTLYNYSGTDVRFEMYSTCFTNEVKVEPQFGIIPKAYGNNFQSTNITIYFAPRVNRMYRETIKVYTSIAQCYIDIPIEGHGTHNEKFYVSLDHVLCS